MEGRRRVLIGGFFFLVVYVTICHDYLQRSSDLDVYWIDCRLLTLLCVHLLDEMGMETHGTLAPPFAGLSSSIPRKVALFDKIKQDDQHNNAWSFEWQRTLERPALLPPYLATKMLKHEKVGRASSHESRINARGSRPFELPSKPETPSLSPLM